MLNTTKDTGVDESPVHMYLQAVTLAVLILLGLGLNLTVIITCLHSRTLRQTKHNLLILHLMATDMIYVLWVMPVTGAEVLCPDYKPCFSVLRDGFLCQMTGFLSVFQCTLACLTLALIATDRYLAVVHPVRYHHVLSKSRCLVLLSVCWVWASLTALPPLLPVDTTARYIYTNITKHCSPSFRASCWYFWYTFTLGYGVPLPTMAFCYFKVSRRLRNHKMKVFTVRNAGSVDNCKDERLKDFSPNSIATSLTDLEDEQNDNNKRPNLKYRRKSVNNLDVKIAKRGALLITAYFLCWSLYAVTHSCPVHLHAPLWVNVTAMWLVYSLTVINPVIYVFNNTHFRAELKKLLLRCKLR